MTVDVGTESGEELGAAYEPVNDQGFVFRATHIHSPEVKIDFTCQRGDRHYFYISIFGLAHLESSYSASIGSQPTLRSSRFLALSAT